MVEKSHFRFSLYLSTYRYAVRLHRFSFQRLLGHYLLELTT